MYFQACEMSALDYILMNILRTNACFDCKLTQTSKLCKGHRDSWKGQIVKGQHRRDGTGRDVDGLPTWTTLQWIQSGPQLKGNNFLSSHKTTVHLIEWELPSSCGGWCHYCRTGTCCGYNVFRNHFFAFSFSFGM